MELLKRLMGSTATEFSKASMLQKHFDRLLNEELNFLVTEAAMVNIEPENEPKVWGPVTRGNSAEAVKQTCGLMRRRFAALLLNHQREEDE